MPCDRLIEGVIRHKREMIKARVVGGRTIKQVIKQKGFNIRSRGVTMGSRSGNMAISR